jgi:hypothetical protein
VPLLALKLVLTPLLVGGASLAARRWGPAVGGLIVALPLTSGPVAFFLALDYGAAFAAEAVVGSLGGLVAIVAFSLAYAAAGSRAGAGAGLVAAALAYLVAGLLVRPLVEASTWLLLALVFVSVALGLRLLPRGGARHAAPTHPWWDLPARMAIATALVVGLTAIAPLLGPHTSGLVATFPVYVAVMVTFTQRHQGAPAAIDVLRGLLAGLFGTAAFYVVVHLAIVPLGIAAGFLLATAITLGIQAIALRRVRAMSPGPIEPEPA